MSFFGFLSSSDLRNFALSRRELLGKSLAIGAVLLWPKPQPKSSYPPPEFKMGDLVASDWEPDEEDDDAPDSQPKSSYPPPEFKMGDLVASDWEPDEEDDDAPDSATDFGEVLGMRWLPEAESCFAANTWVYYIWWTHSTWDGTAYPCYDGEQTRGCDLRLVGLEEKCKR